MGIFKSDTPANFNFNTRSEAFNFMLNYLADKGMDPLEASEKADKFADIYSKNLGIPDKLEPELTGVDKYISIAEKIGNYLEAHPKVLDYGIPAVTFLAGLFTGKKAEEHEVHKEIQVNNPINPEEIVD